MPTRFTTVLLAAIAAIAVPGLATAAVEIGQRNENSPAAQPYLQCVPYARAVSGIQIYGDAHTWWEQAAGRYARGREPRIGAVLAFRPSGNMRLGHVAAVSRVVDSRTVLLRHANWSLINGRRGQIEDNVRAVDVSPENDWSEVRVWYAPIQGLGTTPWPTRGFIYNRPAALGAPAPATVRPALYQQQVAQVRQVPQTRGIPQDDPIGAIIARKSARIAAR
jgi:surface antigen